MSKVYSVAIVFSFSTIFTFASMCFSIAVAQKPVTVAGWKLEKDENSCSLSRVKQGNFAFFNLSAEGRQVLRFHDKGWQFAVGVPVQVQLVADGKIFDLLANGASTSNGWQGFTAAPQANVLVALGVSQQASFSRDGSPPVVIDLSGLHEAIPILLQCAAPLKKRDLSEIPVTSLRVVQLPSISLNELPPDENPAEVLRYKLTVGPDGKPTNCQVVQSSGSPTIDKRTCEILQTRARFKPALNGAGDPVVSSFQSSVRF